MGAALVRSKSMAAFRRHIGEMRNRERPGRIRTAFRAFIRRFIFRHGAHCRKRAADVAEIIVNWHDCHPGFVDGGTHGAAWRRPVPAKDYLSGDIGISTPPLICFIGPSAFGMMSNSKISVGSHSVAQALGISTTPEMCPCTGAVPRMA